MHASRIIVAALLLAGAAAPARAADDIVIGLVYPLSGNAAQVGLDAKSAFETEVDIINGTHDKLPMLLGEGGGLPKLGGAHLKLVFADSQNDPQKARAEAERLITQDHVVAIVGSYSSSTAATISQVTERYEIPYISVDNSSPALTKRGLKWFFRTTANDETTSQAMYDFFADTGKATGRPVKSVSLFYEDSIFGTDSSNNQRLLAKAANIPVTADIRYRANSPSLSSEAQRLKAANADVIMPSSYTSDALLIVRSMNEIGYKPKAVMAQAAGFADLDFLKGAGPLADGMFTRSNYAGDAAKSRPAIPAVNALYKAKANRDLNDNTAREITGLQVLADAINRAGSVKPADLRNALVATDLKGTDLIMPWKGVKFDATGQNTLGNPVIQEIKGGTFHTVWPADVATMPVDWNVGK